MKLEARKAGWLDRRDIYTWRTDKRNSEYSYTGDDFPYSEHEAWFKEYLDDDENLMLIIEVNSADCCVVRLDGCLEHKEVSIYMVPGFHGKNLSLSCLLLAELYLRERLQGLTCSLSAQIMMNNEASVSLFSRAGYRYSMADWYKVI